MNPTLHGALKLLQPAGFILFGLYFLLSGDVQKVNVWFMAALTFTTAGIAYETWYGLKNRYKTPGFTPVVFYGNVVVKALLIGGIALKTVCGDDPRGIAFLAMVVVLAFVWNLLALALKKKKRKGNSELLDDVG